MVALHLADLAPSRIRRMALVAGAAGGAGGASYPIEKFLDVADPQRRAQAALSVKDSRFADIPPDEAYQAVQARITMDTAFLASHRNAANYPRLLRARAGHDVWDKLPKIPTPTLVFAGRYDRQAPPDRAENIAQALPNAKLCLFDGDHGLCFGHPAPIYKLLEEWV
jgi:3-oxoadipate enol-lactonase